MRRGFEWVSKWRGEFDERKIRIGKKFGREERSKEEESFDKRKIRNREDIPQST